MLAHLLFRYIEKSKAPFSYLHIYTRRPFFLLYHTKQLQRFMETQKPYLDPNLSLASLAKAVGIQHHYISQGLNINLEKNFWDFIKECRITEALKILTDPAQDHLSILEVLINVGFNSSSTINQAFKKISGKTPSDYKASCRVEKG